MKFLLVLALSIVGMAAVTTAASAQYVRVWSMLEAERAAGKQLFVSHCAACHGANNLAPSLVGVVGRPAGSKAGFPYSEDLKNSGIIWTDGNLRKWITDNKHMVPHTLMPHVSISDPAEQLYVVEYLKTLKSH
jgi:cytochrome c